MTKKILIPSLLLLVGTCLFAQPLQETDSTAKKEILTPRKTQIKVTTRLHTRGMFLYGGRISTENPAFDVNFTLNRPRWGFFFYKAIDLKDHTSDNNFSLLAFYKNFKLSDRFTITPHIGIFLEQLHGVVDTGSDMSVILVNAYKLNPHFTIDYTAFVGNVVIETENLDWVNRGRLLFISKHLDLTASYWHNNHVLDEQDHMSGSLAAVYKLKLSDSFNMSVGATEFAILKTSDEDELPKTNRFLVTVALQYIR
ncbi:MAG TPA: hypothetical protein VFU05_10045 [Cyclobacteriaceae bacterium]|nr:hypothetical protein [Cyclobacteriaceae bacterium]